MSIVDALVLCRLDYGNGTLVGLTAYLVHRLVFPYYISCWSLFLLSILYHSLLTSSICYCI